MCIQDLLTYLASNRNPEVQHMIDQPQNGPDSCAPDEICFLVDPYTMELPNMIQYTIAHQYF